MTDFTAPGPTERLPTLVRTARGYRVHDPALITGTRYVIDDEGDLVYTRLPAGSMSASVFLGAAAVALTLSHDDWGRMLLLFLCAVLVGCGIAIAVLSLIHVATDPVRSYRNRFGHAEFSVDITDRTSVDWQLCARAERLAASRSWQSGRVDPARTLGGLLWAAVGEGQDEAGQALLALAEPATGPDLTAV